MEDTKDKAPSPSNPSETEKKPQSPTSPSPRPASAPPAQTPPPRPATPSPRPQPQPQPQPTAAGQQKDKGRRTFLKFLFAIGAILSIVPFVPWGSFLSSSVSSTGAYKRQQVVLDLNTPANNNANKAVAGKVVNVNDLTSFPPNSTWLITYPSSGDINVDSQNVDTFVKFALIRLPNELGGSNQTAAAFVAFSKVCVHLWCSPNYDPEHSTDPSDETYQCPCHGSIYKPPDGLAIAGPASLQPAPTNAIPMLTLTQDSSGNLYIEPPVWDVDHNGILGYGRNYQSYEDYILPAAEGKS